MKANDNAAGSKHKDAYVKPHIKTVTIQSVVDAMGPAQASGASGFVVSNPERGRNRGRGRGRGRR